MQDQWTRLAPIELFTGVKFPNYRHLQRAHVWGSPVYVLDPKLQDGKKLPKWTPRARRTLYVGVSPDHSSTVGRVLNLQTGYASSQYHCVYDNHFLTVNCPVDNVFEGKQFTRQSWNSVLELGYKRNIDFEDAHGHARPAPELDEQWLTGPERRLREQIRRDRNHLRRRVRRAKPARRRRVQFAPGTQLQREAPLPREPISTIPPDGRERQHGARPGGTYERSNGLRLPKIRMFPKAPMTAMHWPQTSTISAILRMRPTTSLLPMSKTTATTNTPINLLLQGQVENRGTPRG
jgi:hypothetical protein